MVEKDNLKSFSIAQLIQIKEQVLSAKSKEELLKVLEEVIEEKEEKNQV